MEEGCRPRAPHSGQLTSLPLRDQLRVARLSFYDLAPVKDIDAVRPAYRRRIVGDQDGRPAFHEALESLQDGFFRLDIQPRCGLVQDQYGGIADHRSSNGNS